MVYQKSLPICFVALLSLTACQRPPGMNSLAQNGYTANAIDEEPAILTFRHGILQIVESRCLPCHGPNSSMGLPNWTDYQTIYNKRKKVYRFVVASHFMPLQGTAQAAAMTDQERAEIGQWIKAGAPE